MTKAATFSGISWTSCVCAVPWLCRIALGRPHGAMYRRGSNRLTALEHRAKGETSRNGVALNPPSLSTFFSG